MQRSDQQYVTPPFPAFPSVSRYVPLGSIADAMARVCRSVDSREGVSLVVGPPGTGKSLLCSLLVDRYRETHDVVVLGETPIDSPAAYLRHLLHHLGADYRGIGDADLQLALVDRVCDNDPPNAGLLIIVDEAQALGADVLEAIRMSTNIHSGGQPRVFAVVVGGVRLDDTLAAPSMEPFSQRIAARCYLHPMNADETRHYITETIQCCGADPDSTITGEAISAVHHACSGVPRLVNQIMTEAIDIAEAADESLISDYTIDCAWAQLQQLPSPMIESPEFASQGAPVEFGELEELDETPGADARVEEEVATAAVDSQACDLSEVDCEAGACDEMVCEQENEAADCVAATGSAATESADEKRDLVASTIRENMLSADVASEHAETVKGETQYRSLVSFPVSKVSTLGERRAAVKDPSVIFGEFDDEEDVCLGSAGKPAGARGVAESTPLPPASTPCMDSDSTGSRTIDSQSIDSQCDDLEAMLHQEIIGIGDMSANANFLALHEAADQAWAEARLNEATSSEHSDVESFVDEAEAMPSTLSLHVDERRTSSCELETKLRTDLSDGSLRLTVRDDSDLLIIEEDVDLSRSSSSTSSERDQTEVSVDCHAMIQRMRTGCGS